MSFLNVEILSKEEKEQLLDKLGVRRSQIVTGLQPIE